MNLAARSAESETYSPDPRLISRGRLDGKSGGLYHRVAEVALIHSGCLGKLPEEPGVRCIVLEQSAGLVWFGTNRDLHRFVCC
jgi:hypothetical protein